MLPRDNIDLLVCCVDLVCLFVCLFVVLIFLFVVFLSMFERCQETTLIFLLVKLQNVTALTGDQDSVSNLFLFLFEFDPPLQFILSDLFSSFLVLH